MGSTATAIRLAEDEVLAPMPADRRYDHYGYDRNLLENRIVDAAFRELPGHDIYELPGQITPITPEELSQDAMYSVNSSKFTPIVPLMKKSDYDIQIKEVTVKLDAEEWALYLKSYGQNALIPKIEETNPEFKGRIVQVAVKLTEEEKKAWRVRKSEGWKVSSTIKPDTSGGKIKSVFMVIADGKLMDGEYETQALAREAGSNLMKDNLDISSVTVTSKSVREDGSDLVTLRREVKHATTKVIVSYVQTNKPCPASDGYIVLVRHRD